MAFDRLSIHRYRIDGSSTKSTLVARLEDGESFVDAVNGITIRLISHTAIPASTEVRFASIPCQKASPTLAVLPQTTSGPPGANTDYTLSLTNADSQACPPTSFALSASVPPGWSQTILLATITVSPGGSGQATVSIRPSSTAAAGTYTTTVSGNGSDGRAVTAGVTHVVVDGDNEPPSAPTNLAATANKQQKQIQLSWDRSSDNTAVTGYRVWRDGTLVGSSSNNTWADNAWKSGASYTYVVTAYDVAGNLSTPSNGVMVNLPGAGGKGSK